MDEYQAPRHNLQSNEEIEDYKYRMRRDFEESIRRQKHHMGNWIKYAEWEASIGDFARARSVFERAIDVDY
jgi:crooked neck